MNDLKIFENPEFGTIRTLELNSEPWFVGKDVAEALGYGTGKSLANAVANHVDDDDKGVTKMMTPGGMQNITIINESGLYSLILSSKLPTAKAFKRWVTSEVLPAIRRTGGYIPITPQMSEQEIMARAVQISMNTIAQQKEQLSKQAEQLEQQAPKVLFAESVASSSSSILVFDLAKLLKQNGVQIGGNRLFTWLRENGYLVKRKGSDYNMPTQRSMNLGLFEIKESTHTHADGHVTVNRTPKVTGKGQIYFVSKFLQKELTHEVN